MVRILAATVVVLASQIASTAAETISASSTHPTGNVLGPQRAFDGDPQTRWASACHEFGERGWLQRDFGKPVAFDAVEIDWEVAAARQYRIQVSDDGKTWRTIATKNDGKASEKARFIGLGARGRYVRIVCSAYATEHALYSIWEVRFPGAAIGVAGPEAAVGESPANELTLEAYRDQLLRNIQRRVLAEAHRQHRLAAELDAAGFRLGPWYRLGPLRDKKPLVNWMENSASSFAHEFQVQRDLAAHGFEPLWDKEYSTGGSFPSTPTATRRWTAQPGWIDGYLCDLPRGPAPSAGETQFVYRTITTQRPVTIELDFVVRSPESCRRMEAPGMETWRRQARFECFLDGQSILRHEGRDHRQPKGILVDLTPGVHHFVAKITNNRHAYGFTFALGGLAPPPRRPPQAHEYPWRPLTGYRPGDVPYYREIVEQASASTAAAEPNAEPFDWYARLCQSGRRLYRETGNAPTEPQRRQLWDSVAAAAMQAGEPATTLAEIEFCREAGLYLDDGFKRQASDDELGRVLQGYFANHLASWSGRPPHEIQRFVARLEQQRPNDPGALFTGRYNRASASRINQHAISRVYFMVCHYREGLAKLRDFRVVPSPMPGVETAARDHRGRVVAAMEAALAEAPQSAAGRAHRGRVEALGQTREGLLASLLAADQPRFDDVLTFNHDVEQMWRREITSLPPILFLQRQIHHHDSMMYTLSGSSPFAVRVFDPQHRTLRDVYAHTASSVTAHDVSLSWDGRRVYLGGGGHLFKLEPVAQSEAKQPELQKLTTGQSPVEMPDGRIVFFDNTPGIAPCKATQPRQLLFIADADGGNRKVVSANLTIDTIPQIMNDGRVIFARWDYGVNKNVFNRHALWTQNPDGTGLDLFFGNTVIDPFSFHHPYAIENRPEVVAVFGTHHASTTGVVGLVWQGAGREAADGLGFRRLLPDTASVGDLSPWTAYQDPCPLNEELFLVSYGGEPHRPVSIYLIDRCGNKKAVFEPASTFAGLNKPVGAFCPQPCSARTRPTVIADRVTSATWKAPDMLEQLLGDPDWSQPATMYLQDVYQGVTPEIERGRVKYLAVMEQTVETHPRGGAIGVGTIFYSHRLLGLVPVEPDGSAKFEVPSMRSLYFHILDERGRMLMTMGSDMHAMPGESRSCVGCHEGRRSGGKTPLSAGKLPLAFLKPTVRPRLTGAFFDRWETNGIIEYESTVQPVLDRYCTACHGGAGRMDGNLDLTGSRTSVFNMSYMELVDRHSDATPLVHFTPGAGHTHGQPSNDYDEQAPLARGSLLSKLDEYLDQDHCGRQMSWEERYAVYCWIDANVPFYGHYTQKSPAILTGHARQRLAELYGRRCASCHSRQRRADAQSCLQGAHIWVHHGENSPGQWNVAESGMRVRHLNLTTPENSHALRAPLAKSAGGAGRCRQEDGRPVFADRSDPDYRLLLKSLVEGTIQRDEPTVRELIRRHSTR